MEKPLVTIKGFAPSGLVHLLKNMGWSKGSDFENFDALELGGYCLATPADRLAPVGFRVKVTEVEHGNSTSFRVRGFGFPDTPRAMVEGLPSYKSNRILRHQLAPAQAEGDAEYTLELFAAA